MLSGPLLLLSSTERLAEQETESMLVLMTRKAQEKEKRSSKVSGSVFTTQVTLFTFLQYQNQVTTMTVPLALVKS